MKELIFIKFNAEWVIRLVLALREMNQKKIDLYVTLIWRASAKSNKFFWKLAQDLVRRAGYDNFVFLNKKGERNPSRVAVIKVNVTKEELETAYYDSIANNHFFYTSAHNGYFFYMGKKYTTHFKEHNNELK